MDKWILIAGQFGLPVAILVLIGWFLVRKAWPFLTKQLEDAQAQRKEEIQKFISQSEKFIETIRARDILIAESQREHLKAFHLMTEEFRSLRDEVKRVSR